MCVCVLVWKAHRVDEPEMTAAAVVSGTHCHRN